MLNVVRRITKKGNRLLNQWTGKSYATAKAYNHWRLKLADTDAKDKIIVFTMSKVASSSVLFSLERSGLPLNVFHIHSLQPHKLAKNAEIYKSNWHKGHNPRHLWHSQYLLSLLDKGIGGKKWKVITLVRDPVARAISHFFEILHLQYNYNYYEKSKTLSTEQIVSELIPIFLNECDKHHVPSEWFETELKGVFDVDVYRHPFDPAQGYQIYSSDKAQVLLIRLESLNKCAPAAFKEFMGIENFQISKSNTGTIKDYSDIYKAFVSTCVLPDSYLDEMYTTPYVKLFYSDDEIQAFRDKWQRKS